MRQLPLLERQLGRVTARLADVMPCPAARQQARDGRWNWPAPGLPFAVSASRQPSSDAAALPNLGPNYAHDEGWL